jgi:hypothetical protein
MASPVLNEMSYSSECSAKRPGHLHPASQLTTVTQPVFELANHPNEANISKIPLARHPRVASINSVELEDFFKKSASQAASTRAILIKPSTGSYEDWAQVIENSFNFTSNLKDTSSFARQLDATRFGSPAKFDAKQMYIEKKILGNQATEVSNVVAMKKEDSRENSCQGSKQKSCERILLNQTGTSEPENEQVFVETLIPDFAPVRQGSKSPEFGTMCTPRKPKAFNFSSSAKVQVVSSRPREYTLKDRLQDCIQQKSSKTRAAITASNSKPASFKNTPTKQISSRMPLSHRSSSKLDVKNLLMEKHKKEIFDSLSKKHKMAFDSAKREENHHKTEFERLLDRKRETSLKKTANASSTHLNQLEASGQRVTTEPRAKETTAPKTPNSKKIDLENPTTIRFSRPMTSSNDRCSLHNKIEPATLSTRHKNEHHHLSRMQRSPGKPNIAFGALTYPCDFTPFKIPVHLAQRRKQP